MLALVLENTLSLRKDYPVPVPGTGEALIKISKAGICRTDLELIRGYKRFSGVLGHEFVGVVVQHPDPAWVGQRVVGDINISCGQCVHCRNGRVHHCAQRRVVGILNHDGAFAEYITLPQQNLYKIPQGVPDDVTVFSEPVAAALEILQQTPILPSDRVLVFGDGKLGQLCAQVIAMTHCDVTLLGHHEHKLEIASQAGVSVYHLGHDKTVPSHLAGADMVIDCTGNPQGLALALHMVRPRGTVILKSTYEELAVTDVSSIVVRELKLIGSRCGPMEPALRLLCAGKIKVHPLISAVYPLANGIEALKKAGEHNTIKVLLEM
jgi:threonine dehydrogenase-like Zn-dependent dehydrogenase